MKGGKLKADLVEKRKAEIGKLRVGKIRDGPGGGL
jgi:hypothetical protein